MVDRTAELAVLEDALLRARAGEPVLCLVSGESGVGKTCLSQAFVEAATADGVRALVGGCVPTAAREVPFAPVLEAFRSVPDIVPLANGSPASPSSQARMFEGFLGDLGRLSGQRPVVFVVEDLHWADRSTLDLLAFLARNLHDEPVMIVLTCRSDQLDPADPIRRWLAEVPRLRPVLRLELSRLTRAETAAQISALLGADPDFDLVDAVFARSEGARQGRPGTDRPAGAARSGPEQSPGRHGEDTRRVRSMCRTRGNERRRKRERRRRRDDADPTDE